MTREELINRLSEETNCPQEWRHVLELYSVLKFIEAQGVSAPFLKRHFEDAEKELHASYSGNAALAPREVAMRGSVAGGVMWLVDQGWDVEKARKLISDTTKLSYTDVAHWHRQAKSAPPPTGNYRLSRRGAADRMVGLLNKKNKKTDVVDIITDAFAPPSEGSN